MTSNMEYVMKAKVCRKSEFGHDWEVAEAYGYVVMFLHENSKDIKRIAHVLANIDELTCFNCGRVLHHCKCRDDAKF